jgi:hypothetical protein
VINADADEFWWARDSDSLVTALAVLPKRYGTVTAPRENLVAEPGRSGPWPQRLVLRDLLSLHQRGGRIGSKTCHRAHPEITIEQGNHALAGPGLGEPWPASPITILHAPDRSYEQFANKIRVGGASLAANPELAPGFGWHWRADYERLLNGTLEQEWQSRQLTAEQATAGLAAGRLVRDERLVKHLTALLPRAVRPDLLRAVLTGNEPRQEPRAGAGLRRRAESAASRVLGRR